jgi:hypothetical protein
MYELAKAPPSVVDRLRNEFDDAFPDGTFDALELLPGNNRNNDDKKNKNISSSGGGGVKEGGNDEDTDDDDDDEDHEARSKSWYEKVCGLNYAHSVTMEVLRLHPSVPKVSQRK